MALVIVSWVAVILGLLTAIVIVFDVVAYPQPMKIMNVVWPVTGLYLPIVGWWLYADMDRVFSAAAVGSFLMSGDMTAVIDLLLENPRGFGDVHVELSKASKEVRRFLAIIEVGESRLAAGLRAIANSSAPRINLNAFARTLKDP